MRRRHLAGFRRTVTVGTGAEMNKAAGIGAVVAVIVVAGVVGGHGSGGHSSAAPSADAGTQLACGHFRDVMRDEGAGLLTDTELRSKLKEVYSTAQGSTDRVIFQGAQDMLAAVTAGDDSALASGDSGVRERVHGERRLGHPA